MFKSGFITVLGRSNVGKSTFLNRIIGEKLSIISNKPQTTRYKIKMIHTDDKMQCIFLDTPGIQQPKNKLGEYMLKTSKDTIKDADIITYIVDNNLKIGENENYIIDFLKTVKKPIILLINKIDLIPNTKIEELISLYKSFGIFDNIIPISSTTGKNIDLYFDKLYDLLPEGPMYYDEDEITDQPIKKIVSEIIREKTLLFLGEEVPHGINVIVDSMKKRDNKDLYDIYTNIIVEKKSHKGIVIGKNGSMLKQIGTEARKDIEIFLDSKINLKIWVKIDTDWRNKNNKLSEYGYN